MRLLRRAECRVIILLILLTVTSPSLNLANDSDDLKVLPEAVSNEIQPSSEHQTNSNRAESSIGDSDNQESTSSPNSYVWDEVESVSLNAVKMNSSVQDFSSLTQTSNIEVIESGYIVADAIAIQTTADYIFVATRYFILKYDHSFALLANDSAGAQHVIGSYGGIFGDSLDKFITDIYIFENSIYVSTLSNVYDNDGLTYQSVLYTDVTEFSFNFDQLSTHEIMNPSGYYRCPGFFYVSDPSLADSEYRVPGADQTIAVNDTAIFAAATCGTSSSYNTYYDYAQMVMAVQKSNNSARDIYYGSLTINQEFDSIEFYEGYAYLSSNFNDTGSEVHYWEDAGPSLSQFESGSTATRYAYEEDAAVKDLSIDNGFYVAWVNTTGLRFVQETANSTIVDSENNFNYIFESNTAPASLELNISSTILADVSDNRLVVFDLSRYKILVIRLEEVSAAANDFTNQYNAVKDDDKYATFTKSFDYLSFSFNFSQLFQLFTLRSPEISGIKFAIEITNSTGAFTVFDDVLLDTSIVTTTFTELTSYFKMDYDLDGFYLSYTLGAGNEIFTTTDTITADLGAGISKFKIKIDYVWIGNFDDDYLERIEMTYASDEQRIYRLSILFLDYIKTLNIFGPLTLNLTSVNPARAYSYDTSAETWLLENLAPATYTFTFRAGTDWGVKSPGRPKIAALTDVTSQYFENADFERRELDWQSRAGVEYTSVTLNYTIVSEGFSSMRLEQSDSYYAYLDTVENIPPGLYYVSFDYYIESLDSPFVLYYRNSSTWKNVQVASTSTVINRWHKFFAVIETDATNVFNLALSTSSADGVIFLDNLKIWDVSNEVKKTGHQKFEFSSTFIHWDGYQNNLASNIDVEFELRDSSDSSIIAQSTLRTDEVGHATLELTLELEGIEYEVRWYSLNSYFAPNQIDLADFLDPVDWSAWATQTIVSFDVSDNVVTLAINSTADAYYIPIFEPTSDFSQFDYFVHYMGISSTSNVNRLSFIFRKSGSNQIIFNNSTLSTSLIRYVYDFTQPTSSNIDGSGITETMPQLILNSAETSQRTFAMANWHGIYAQKSYFTPLNTTTDFELYETDNSFIFTSESDTLQYYVIHDTLDYYSTDLVIISKNMTTGTHSFDFLIVQNTTLEDIQLSSTWFNYTYTISESGLMVVRIVDQQSNFIDAKTFRIEVNSTRIYSDTFYLSDISQTFNLTISDFWGNVLYQNLNQEFIQFLDLQLTLYSVKIYNEMDSPVYIQIANGPIYSAWILPGEIIEYRLFADNYNMTLQYSNTITGFSAATLNGTAISYIYTVAADTALKISHFSIIDVYTNVVSLIDSLYATNSTLYAEIGDLQLQVDLTNDTQVALLIENYDAILDSFNAAAEYMSEFRVESQSMYRDDESISFTLHSNWANSTVTIRVNDTEIGTSVTEGTLAILYSFDPGLHNITVFVNYTSPLISGYLVYEYLVTMAPFDLSLLTNYYDIQVLDLDGYVFHDFPLLIYYNDKIVSRGLIPLPGNETFDENLLSFGNEQGFSFSALNVTVEESVSSNVFVVLAYLDLIKIHFENAGIYSTLLNVSRTPGNYSLTNETISIPQGGRNYWLPPGNYSAVIYEVRQNTTTEVNDPFLKRVGFIESIQLSSKLQMRSFDASSTANNYNPSINNEINTVSGKAVGGISASLVVFFLVSKFGDEIYKYFRFKITGKRGDEALDKEDLGLSDRPQSSSRRYRPS